jgi:hypothetical protein
MVETMPDFHSDLTHSTGAYIHTYSTCKLYLTTLAPTTVRRLISMKGVKYRINYLQKIKNYER